MTVRLDDQAARDRAMSPATLARLLDELVPCPDPGQDCILRYLGLAKATLRDHLRVVHGWSTAELERWSA